ncbi:MAG TPA: hypothetical protein PKA13_18825 [Geminicoccaceae bacterium]|nr:hypothetical protein [Geminicoccus sp.]HMU51836.1 hypothetical protein [Geminicoccaceae bacterium]
MTAPVIATVRLLLRDWRDEDLPAFAALNADRRVMERLGMRRSAGDDFEYPGLPPGHPLRPHLLYRLAQGAWRDSQS